MTPLIIAAIFVAAILFIGIRKRMLKQMIIMLIGIGIVVGIVGYVKYQGFQGFMAMKEGMSKMKQTVATAKATTQAWSSRIEAVGSLRAVKGVDISNELPGTVEDIHFNSGGDVEEGALLIKLRAEDDLAKLASLEAAAKLSDINFNRDKKQLSVQAVSQAIVDADAANLASARALAAQQKALVDKKIIHAPFSGHLGIRNVDVGQYLTAGTAIVTLQQLDPIYMDFTLPQQSLSKIEVGQKIALKNDTYPGQAFDGAIVAINPKVDITTRNVQIRAQLPNTDRKLLPGMYATAEIEVGEDKQFVTVPQAAITYNPYGNTVYIVRHTDELPAKKTDAKAEDHKAGDAEAKAMEKPDANKDAPKDAPKEEVAHKPIGDKDDDLAVEQVFVTVGETRGDQVQVLKGVKDGDTIISAGQLKLQNGSAIVVNNAVTPKNDSNPSITDQ